MLDTPAIAEEVTREARQLHELHGLPFRLATMNRNVGFANVNNAGASLAEGRLLVLVNSDVLPDRPGWLGKMAASYDATPDIGALGPKLLYEDGSVQHAGMHFEWDSDWSVWHNVHYFKGYSRDLPAANIARPVPAVTGACLMIDRTLYDRVGGLSHEFVMGGYEDSDLCLKLLEDGRQNWYMPGAELYHLEGQSFPLAGLRLAANRYNTWLQTMRWGRHIESINAEADRVQAIT